LPPSPKKGKRRSDPVKGNIKGKISPWLKPKLFSRHSAQRSSASLACRFVSAPEAEQRFLSLVDPYPFVATAFVSETYKPDGRPVDK
jgi:hypothetical protein